MTQDCGLKRNPIDKFYTNHKTVKTCGNSIKKHLQINRKNDLIIEPSAGNGSFISMIKTLSENYLYFDIAPDNPEIQQQDFLQINDCEYTNKYEKIHIIGNPPFGRQSSLAIKFIKKASGFCDSISFILPKSFKKDSLRKVFPLQFHLICERDLPENSFEIDGHDYHVETIFQIWEKKEFTRQVIEILEPVHFSFVKKNENHDISFRRVGVYAGKIDTYTTDKSIQSHYFIKFTNHKTIEDNIKRLHPVRFQFNNTVGPKSISKQELIKEFNRYL
jgi:predicted RNA methylase